MKNFNDAEIKAQEIDDEKNPNFIFQLTDFDLLVQIAKGEIDPVELAKKEIANRGFDINGKWVGF